MLVATALLLWGEPSAARGKSSAKAGTASKSASSGKALFAEHCAACHGDDAKGAGPAALALKTQPPDLTALAKRNRGRFPYDEVHKAIDGEFSVPAHGSREMPTWGAVFLALTPKNPFQVDRHITDLTNYIKSIQVK